MEEKGEEKEEEEEVEKEWEEEEEEEKRIWRYILFATKISMDTWYLVGRVYAPGCQVDCIPV